MGGSTRPLAPPWQSPPAAPEGLRTGGAIRRSGPSGLPPAPPSRSLGGRRRPHRPPGGGPRSRPPRPEVVDAHRPLDGRMLEREQVRLGQVRNVDVIPYGSPVGSGIVNAVDLQMRDAAQGRLDGERDEVSLWLMALSKLAVRISPRGVEVPQRGRRQPIRSGIPGDHALRAELRLA